MVKRKRVYIHVEKRMVTNEGDGPRIGYKKTSKEIVIFKKLCDKMGKKTQIWYATVVKESILWLGFKRPSTYWGWKRDAQCSASIYKQVSEIRNLHTWLTEGWYKLSLQSSSCSSRSKRPTKQIIPSSNQYDHI